MAREHELWFHVDGAYGGAGLFAPSVRAAYAGLEHADSFVVDPHKWLFSPFDCAALLYRDPALARSVHTQDAGYLDVIHEQPGEWNPTDYAYHLTRRARGLPLWFSLCVYGVRAYSAAIETAIGLAQQAAAEIAARDYLELVREPSLSVVLFRRRGWSPADYSRWADKLLDDQVAFMPPTTWEGETVARFAFLHPQTPRWTWSREILDRMAARHDGGRERGGRTGPGDRGRPRHPGAADPGPGVDRRVRLVRLVERAALAPGVGGEPDARARTAAR